MPHARWALTLGLCGCVFTTPMLVRAQQTNHGVIVDAYRTVHADGTVTYGYRVTNTSTRALSAIWIGDEQIFGFQLKAPGTLDESYRQQQLLRGL